MNEWNAVIGYEGLYEIDRLGNVRSVRGVHKNRILVSKIDRGGYWKAALSKKGITKKKFIHRLLAENFISNPENKSFVNHINGIKTDNSLENLEWVTHSENMLHAYKTNLIKKKLKKVLDTSTNCVYSCCKEAASFFKISPATLRGYLNGTIKKNPTSLVYY